MTNRVDFLYWTVAHDLIINKGYRMFQLSPSHNEVWLEGGQRKKEKIVRLVRVELDWSNQLVSDLNRVSSISKQLRKKLRKKDLIVENLYFTTYEPVDDYEERLIPRSQTGSKDQPLIFSSLITSQTDTAQFGENHPLSSIDFIEPAESDFYEDQVNQLKHETITFAEEMNATERKLFNNASPFFTYVFIVLQLAMFYLLESNGGSTNTQVLIDYGAKYNPSIEAGEWWRFFTPIVLHIGILHLLMNTLALFYLGPLIERIYGRTRFLIIYLFAGFVGSLMSFIFTYNISAGASGAIFGCFGALLYFGVRYPKLFFRTMGVNVLVVIGINIAFGFSIPGIDNAGHLGGLAGGFLAAGIVSFPNHAKPIKQLGFLAAAAGIVWLSLQAGYSGSFVQKNPMAVNAIAQEEIQNGDYETAYENLLTLKDDGEATAETYFLLSFIELNDERYEEAVMNLEKAIDEREDFHEAHYNLALAFYDTGKYEQALEHANKALTISPEEQSYKDLVEELSSL